MKVLHLIDSLDFGGAQTVVKGIFEHHHSNDIFLLALRKTERIIVISHPNITLYNSSSKYSFLPLLKIRQLIKREKIDILHCHLFRSQVFGWLVKIFCCSKIKLVFHEHGQIFGSDTDNLLEDKLFILFLQFAKNKVDLFIAVSETTKNKLITRINIEYNKINVLYNPIHLKSLKKSQTKSNVFYVGFIGRLIERKGVKIYLQAAQKILKNHDNIIFLIAGDGPQKSIVIDTIKQINRSNKVNYLGYIQDVSQFYSKLDCLVIPSLWEPMGMVVIEAQLAGVPIIASDIDSFKELITDKQNGIFFKSKNVQDLINKIEFLVKDNELQKKIIYNAYNSSQNFSTSSYLPKLKQLYYLLTNIEK